MSICGPLALLALSTAAYAPGALTAVELRKWIPSFAGPYIAHVDILKNCEDSEMDKTQGHVAFKMRLSRWSPMRPSELRWISGNVSVVNTTINDDDWVVGSMAVRSNNQWKENAVVWNVRSGACSFMRSTMQSLWRILFPADAARGAKPCLVEQGETSFNSTVDWTSPNFPVLPCFYRMHLHGGEPGRQGLRPSLCLFADVHIVPKAS